MRLSCIPATEDAARKNMSARIRHVHEYMETSFPSLVFRFGLSDQFSVDLCQCLWKGLA